MGGTLALLLPIGEKTTLVIIILTLNYSFSTNLIHNVVYSNIIVQDPLITSLPEFQSDVQHLYLINAKPNM